MSLIRAGLLYGDRSARPTRTFASQDGRREICRILAVLADEVAPPHKHTPNKISAVEAETIRRRRIAGDHPIKIARKVGISESQVYNILAGRSWKAVQGEQLQYPHGPYAMKVGEPPLRDRAEYMRAYKRRRRAAQPDFQETVNG